MGAIGTGELLLIFIVVLLVFGAKRIPEIARNMGTAIAEFRASTREIQKQLDLSDTLSTRPAPRYAVNHPPPTGQAPLAHEPTTVDPPPSAVPAGGPDTTAQSDDSVAG